MTTTDTDALKKRFARALYVSWWTDHMQDPSASYDHPLNEDAREACESAADALLPIVAEEVRKEKADAFDEGWKDRARRDAHRAYAFIDEKRNVLGPPASLNPYRTPGTGDNNE